MRRLHIQVWALLLASALVVSACGLRGDAARGQQLFNGQQLIGNGSLPACNTCHADTADGPSPLGPNLSNIGQRAGSTVEGQSAEVYLRDSMLKPDEYLAPGFQEGIMYREYPKVLTDQDVADLVAYMLTLRSGQN